MAEEEPPSITDRDRAQAAYRGAVRGVAKTLHGKPAPGSFGTDFENHELDQILDLIESTKPTDLTNTGDALADAGRALKKVASDIADYSKRVEWEGESGEQFRKWTEKLASSTRQLAGYAKTAGKELKNAGTGLAEVKSSMPKRDADGGLEEAVKDIPAPARVPGNEKYDKLSKREGDRQEAINLMYKLSSYYQVSTDSMVLAQEPTFPRMPDMGMPEAPTGEPPRGAPVAPGGEGRSGGETPDGGVFASPSSASGSVPTSGSQPQPDVPQSEPVGTEIDSVAPPSAPPHSGGTESAGPPTPAGGGGNPGSGVPTSIPPPRPTAPGPRAPVPPMAPKGPGGQPPMTGRAPGSVPPGASSRPTSPGTGTGVPPMRPGTSVPAAPGRAGSGNSLPGSTGRSGAITPGAVGRPAAASGTGTFGPRSGNPIVGGLPQQGGSRATARVPGGRVVGAERGADGRSGSTGAGTGGAPTRGSRASRSRTAKSGSRPGKAVGATDTPDTEAQQPAQFTPGGTGLVTAKPERTDTRGASTLEAGQETDR